MDAEKILKSKGKVLLTGAGFTHNFGGFLAADMWAEIFNHKAVQAQLNVRNLLLQDLDFESAYSEVIYGDRFNEHEKQAMRMAVFSAYERLDFIVRNYCFNNDAPYPVNIYMVRDFLERFKGGSCWKGAIFTLNQDLFLERHYNYNGMLQPGIRNGPVWVLKSGNHVQALNENGDFCVLPSTINNNDVITSTFSYIKLHGSQNWLSSDGSRAMVLGMGKNEQVQREPLLAKYFEIFKETLSLGDVRLLIVGYGFRDEHVNEIMKEAIEKHGLKIYIVSPESPNEFHRSLRHHKDHSIFWNGLGGYFRCTLLQMFPKDQSESVYYQELKECFFES